VLLIQVAGTFGCFGLVVKIKNNIFSYTEIILSILFLSVIFLFGCSNGSAIDIPLNNPPVSDAGSAIEIQAGKTIFLSNNSYDPDNDNLTYLWSVISYPVGSRSGFMNAIAKTPEFVFDLPGDYRLGLVADDGKDYSPMCHVDISVFDYGMEIQAEAYEKYGHSLANGDFNGDGYADLATGIPGKSNEEQNLTCAINIINGFRYGLTTYNNKNFYTATSIIESFPDTDNSYETSAASGDFNGDGYDDIATGIPGETVSGQTNAGIVKIIYGSVIGLSDTGIQSFHQDVDGMEGTVLNDDFFGWAVASGDFNNDGYDDLAIGSPFDMVTKTNEPSVSAGTISLLFGSPDGLSTVNNRLIHQSWLADYDDGGPEAGDQFGFSLVVGDINNDGYSDLAVGVPGEDRRSNIPDSGAVVLHFGSEEGLSDVHDIGLHQDTGGIVGRADSEDRFGHSVEMGDFNGDGFDDLAIGVPSEKETDATAGLVHILNGSGSGVTATGNIILHQDSAGFEGNAVIDDAFGKSLSAGDFNHDGFCDLVVGIPGKTVETSENAGAISIIYGSENGLTDVGNKIIHQNTPDIIDSSETSDHFGRALCSGDFNNDGFDDLAAGAPGEAFDSKEKAGLVNILFGSETGLSTLFNQTFHGK